MNKALFHINHLTKNAGFSLVEVIVSTAIFGLLVLSTMGLYFYSLDSMNQAGENARAQMIANEGIAAVKNVRDSVKFEDFVDGTFGLTTLNNQWELTPGVESVGIYTRTITISTVDPLTKMITAVVSWPTSHGESQSITLTSYLSLWKTYPWVDVTFCDSVYDVSVAECRALLAFYKNTNGPSWTNHEGWGIRQTVRDWTGVTLENGHVTRLDLPNNKLSGTIPPEFHALKWLTHINLSGNGITSIDHDAFLGQNLAMLNLSSNFLQVIEQGTLTQTLQLNSLNLVNNCIVGGQEWTEIMYANNHGANIPTDQTGVCYAPIIRSTSLPDGIAGMYYNFSLEIDNYPETIESISGLPPGMVIAGNALSGVPQQSGDWNITFKASNRVGFDEKVFSLHLTVDYISPTISLREPVPDPTDDTTPPFTVTSSEAGNITYGGACTSDTTRVESGDNVISFLPLELGTYNDCTLTVTDGSGNVSNLLTLPSFTIVPPEELPPEVIPFITRWYIDSSSPFTIPINPNIGGYDYTIDWGDGTIETHLHGDATHSYESSGTYDISISGLYPAINMGNNSSLSAVVQWGNNRWATMNHAFSGASYLTSIPLNEAPDLSLVTDMSSMFEGAHSFNKSLNSWNVSTVTNMSHMFSTTQNYNQSMDLWDVSHVTDMSSMFEGACAFDQSIDAWNMSHVVNAESMFANTCVFNKPIHINTSSITNMHGMFSNATRFNQLLDFDTSHVTDMSDMFDSAMSFNQDISAWDTSSVTNMSGMFSGALSFNKPLGTWDTLHVTDMSNMFSNATSFNQSINDWDVGSVTNMENMFFSALNFNQPLGSWNTSQVKNFQTMFMWATSFNQPLNSWQVQSAEQMGGMFSGATSFNQPLGSWIYNRQNHDLTAIFDDSGLSSHNYDIFLSGLKESIQNSWDGVDYGTDLWLGAGNIMYCNTVAHDWLVELAPYDQSRIIDGGLDPLCGSGGSTGSGGNGTSLPRAGSFITTWNILPPNFGLNTTIFINANPYYIYNYQIDWGDGTVQSATGSVYHTYTAPGTYSVIIRGLFPAFQISDSHLIGVEQWGDQNWQSMEDAFRGAYNLVSFPQNETPKLLGVTNVSHMFHGAQQFNQPLNSWDTSSVTDMVSMFQNATSFNQPLGSWNISGVTDLSHVFDGATAFNSDISSWDTSHVQNMSYLFAGATSFNQPLNSWNTGVANNMSYMFSGASSFNQPLSLWNTSSLVDPIYMFQGATDFDQSLDSWDVSSVTRTIGMFAGASHFNQPLNSWNTGVVNNMRYMFSGASSFNQPLNNWNVDLVTDMGAMFSLASSFNQPLDTWHVDNVSDMGYMFNSASAFDQSLSTWNIANVTRMDHIFQDITLSTAHYDALLSSWSQIARSGDISFDAGNSKYCDENSRNLLSNAWFVFDGGLSSTCGGGGELTPGAFVTSWMIDASHNLTISTNPNYVYYYNIDWGDGTYEVGKTGDAYHTYTDSGTFTVTITGTFPAIRLGNDSINAQKLRGILQWGNISWQSMESAFRDAINLQIFPSDTPDLSQVYSMAHMFQNDSALSVQINNWNTSNVTDMSSLFQDAPLMQTELSQWDVSRVTDMSSLFQGASAMHPDISQWNTGSVQNMQYMFAGATSFNQSINNWNTSNVQNMQSMFQNATSFNQDLSGWNTGSVQNMQSMFAGATSFNQSINNWNTASVHDMSYMFQGATSFNQDLGSWNTGIVNNMSYMFQNATSFDQSLNSWNTGSVQNMQSMFQGATSFNQDLSNWNTTSVNDMSYMFQGSTLFNQNISSWNAASVNYMQYMFAGATSFNQSINDWNTASTQNMSYMFQGATSFNQDLSSWNTSSVNDMAHMFQGANSFNQSIYNWNTASVQNMSSMFQGASSFNQDIGSLNISSVNNMSHMFDGATLFNQSLSNWNTANVHDMSYMFQDATSFNQDISSWNTASVNYMQYMFAGANAFNQNLANWNISQVYNMQGMFQYVTLSTPNYDALLDSWSNQSRQYGVTFDAGYSYFCHETSRNALTNNYSWSVSDSGKDSTCASPVSPIGAFITTWRIQNYGESLTIPVNSNYGSSYDIDWGDGTFELAHSGDASHTYSAPGDYTVTINGTFPALRLGNDPTSAQKLIAVVQWGTIDWQSMEYAFRGATNLTSIPSAEAPNLTNVHDMSYMFQDATSFNQDISSWNTASVNYMQYMFAGANAFNQNLANWNISQVYNMQGMFQYVTLSTPNYDALLDSWSNQSRQYGVTFDAGYSYFCHETSRNALTNNYSWSVSDSGKDSTCASPVSPIGAFITTWRIQNYGESLTIPVNSNYGSSYDIDWGDGTFELAHSGDASHTYSAPGDYTVTINGTFPALRLGNDPTSAQKLIAVVQWGTIDWQSMEYAFRGATNLTSIPSAEAPNLTNVHDMSYMFQDATSFNQDISSWNTASVNYMQYMFAGANAFNQNLANWNISQVYNMQGMFQYVTLSTPNYDALLDSWSNQSRQYGVTFDAGYSYFCHETSRNALTNNYSWSVSDSGKDSTCASPVSPIGAFITTWRIQNYGESLTIPVNSNYGSSYDIDWGDGTFELAHSGDASHTYSAPGDYTVTINGTFPALRLGNDPTSAQKLIAVVQWGTIDWQSMEYAFRGATNLTSIPSAEAPNLTNVHDMSYMFQDATSFNQDISSWNTASVNYMQYMFAGANAFNQNLANWNISQVYNMQGMFQYVTLSTPNYDALLDSWSNQSRQYGVTFDAGYSYFCHETSRNALTNNYSWSVSDSGKDSTCASPVSPIGAFITTWRIQNYGESLTIPVNSNYGSSYDIDWGDGTFELAHSGDASHTYSAPGDYTVTINGTFPALRLGNDPTSAQKLIAVVQWGTIDWQSMEYAFRGATNLTSIPSAEAPNLTNVHDMSYMFQDATSFNQDISSWNTASVNYMQYMFAGANAFNQNLANWNISQVYNMQGMFQYVTLSTPNYDALLDSWSNQSRQYGVTFDAGYSYFCHETSRNALTNNYSWSVSDSGKDSTCASPVSPIGAFITTWRIQNYGESLTIPVNSNYGSSYDIDWGDGTFELAHSGDASHTYFAPGDYTVTINGTFPALRLGNDPTSAQKLIAVVQWGTIDWQSMEYAFRGATNLTSIPSAEAPNLTNVHDMSYMFQDATSFNQDISSWNTASVNYMQYMFAGANAFNQNLANWNISQVYNMQGMFQYVTLSTPNYDALLDSWSNQSRQYGVTFDAGYSYFCHETSRNALTNNYSWSVSDSGKDSNCSVSSSVVSRVSTSSPSGLYKTGMLISIDVQFDKTVYVAGTPELILNTGGQGTRVQYVSGSGSDTLTFNYVVSEGQRSSDLDYVSVSSLELNNGSILDIESIPVDLSLPSPGSENSLSGSRDIIVATFYDFAPAIDILGQYLDVDAQSVSYTNSNENNGAGSVNILGFSGPQSMALDTINHRLFVSDLLNNRVVVFDLDSQNILNDRVPDYVLGQPNFFLNSPGDTASGLHAPAGLAFDSNNQRLFVAESSANRIKVWSVSSLISGQDAINILGQNDFSTYTASDSQSGLRDPYGLVFDPLHQRLFVSEFMSNRVKVWNVSSLSDGQDASNILGQSNFTDAIPGDGETGLRGPMGLTYDPLNDRLFVAEMLGNRVKVFDVSSIADGQGAVNVLGQMTWSDADPSDGHTGLRMPYDVAYDTTLQRLFVSELQGNRVKVWNAASLDLGQPAMNVLGQPNFDESSSTSSQNGLNNPHGIMYDSTNQRLFVSEFSGNRVKVFDAVSTLNPFVILITSDTPDGSYGPGYRLSLQVVFSENVIVTGAPYLLLSANNAYATYESGSGTNILNFDYIVENGQSSPDLDIASTTPINLNGGSIRSVSFPAILTFPAPNATGSLAANKSLIITN